MGDALKRAPTKQNAPTEVGAHFSTQLSYQTTNGLVKKRISKIADWVKDLRGNKIREMMP
jgi:hypothetical protein